MLSAADIAVVGGGAAAAAVLIALTADGGQSKPSVLWVAPETEDGRGLAYRTSDAAHRLNVRAGRMSVRADCPADFVDFLTERDGGADAEAFYPRRRYGEYLLARVARSASRSQVERWTTSAQAAGRHDGAWQITGADGRQRYARHMVLAIGPQASMPASGVAPILLEQGRYRLDPYAWVEQPYSVGELNAIFILGSGLTAVDLALTAARTFPQAVIHLLSRHGALPAAHADAHAVGADPLSSDLDMPVASALLRRVRIHCDGLNDWRDGIDALRARTADRWHLWPDAERKRFLRHARWAWDRVRHRMAPEVAVAVSELIRSGQLMVHRGRFLGAEPSAQSITVGWQPRGSSTRREVRTDLILQATGLNCQVRNSRMPLLRSLLDGGCARPDALDLGLAVDAGQRLLDGNGGVHFDAHVVGALARGSRFECIAMPEIRVTAAAVAAHVMATQRTG